MMTDRELLQLAANAAGIKIRWDDHWDCFMRKSQSINGWVRTRFEPLDDNDDAREIAYATGQKVKRKLDSATRRAIVMAAAGIGKEASDGNA